MVRIHRFPLLLLCLLLAAGMLLWTAEARAGATPITAEVNHNPVAINQSFTLTFTAKGSVDGDPDFSPLKHDFEIISRAKSTNLELINGSFSRTTQWKLSLMARRAGKLTIPAIHFGSDSSQPISLTVSKAIQASAPNNDLFIDVQVSNKKPYVQSEVIYKMRLFRAVDLENATLSDLKVKGGNAIVEQLGEDKHYRLNRNGQRYAVIERDYAILPQQSGKLTIEPLVLTGDVYRGVNSLWDPFGQKVRTERVESDPVALQVKPVPAAFTGRLWLPAHSLQLQEAWSPQHPKFEVGEPVTRTIAIIAAGLTAGQLPDINENIPHSIKQYPNQPRQNDQKNPSGVVGVRQEKVALIPQKPGTYVLPAITVPWWNVDSDKMEVARLPARTISVSAAPGTAAKPKTPPAPAPRPQHQPSAKPPPPAPPHPAGSPVWPWLAGAFGMAWVGTLLIWWSRSRRRDAANQDSTRRAAAAPSPRTLRDNVLRACDANDASEAKKALLAWGGWRWPNVHPASLGELARLCDSPLQEAVRELNECLYGPNPAAWRGRRLKQALAAAAPPRTPGRRKTDELEPLYKT